MANIFSFFACVCSRLFISPRNPSVAGKNLSPLTGTKNVAALAVFPFSMEGFG